MPPSAPPFGAYARKTSPAALLLIALRRMGLLRGALHRLASRIWQKLGHDIVDTRINGIRWRLHIARNSTDRKILTRSRPHDGPEIAALRASIATHGGAFVDVGANTGYYSLTLAKLGCAQIIAIEPNPPTLAALTFNVRQNPWQHKIAVFPVGVGDGQDLPIYSAHNLGEASLLPNGKNAPATVVRTMPLLDILRQANVARIGGMKVDVEGYEDRALAPFFAAAPPSLYPKTVVIERNAQRWQQDIIALMQQKGYAIVPCKLPLNLILQYRPPSAASPSAIS